MIDENFGLKERSAKKLFNLFCLVIFLFNLIAGFFSAKNFAGYFISKLNGYIAGVLLFLLPLVIIYLLYKRNNWGWALFVSLNILLGLQDIWLLFEFFQYREFLFAPPNPYYILLSLCFHMSIVVFLNSKKIIEQFTITKEGRITTLIISGLLFILLIFIL